MREGSLSKNLESRKTGLLWQHWETTVRRNRRRIILIEADRDITWTASTLNDEVDRHLDVLAAFPRATRFAFCLPNGADWMTLFLALQKRCLVAVPMDTGLPEPACLETARHLRCQALLFHGKIHRLEMDATNKRTFCCVKVTSGTSGGAPKQIPCRAGHLIADGSHIIRTMGIRARDRNLASIPLGHSYGLGNLVMPLILQGTSLVCAGHFVPRQLLDWIELHRVSVFPSVPAIFRVLAAMPGDSRLTSLRLAISAGAPLTAEIAQAFFDRYGLKIHNFYGSSETGGISYDRKGDATLCGRSIGKPLRGVKIAINAGVIKVESPAVASPGQRWRMPDRGEWNKKNELVLRGRSGLEVNIGGKKVHPSEIEQALRTIPGVLEGLVWMESSAERSFLLAVVETHLPLSGIQRALSDKLPAWKLPKRYFVTNELPRTVRGKIDMVDLRRKIQADTRSFL